MSPNDSVTDSCVTTAENESHAQQALTNEESPQSNHSEESTARTLQIIEKYIRLDPSDIDLSGLRIFSLEEVCDALEKFASNVHALSLQKNLVHDLTRLPPQVAASLRVLDLYDNKIRRISNIEHLSSLTKLDLSYNQIERIEGLDALVNLEELYLVENRIEHISGLQNLKKLRVLELGGNRIRSVPAEALSGLSELRELYLGKNKITHIGDFSRLTNLRTVSLQANRLRSIPTEAFSKCHSIEQLYLSENGIEAIDPKPLAGLTGLKVLDLSMNPISSLAGMEDIAPHSLREFWCTAANVATFEDVQRLAKHSNLEMVFFEQNPIQRKEKRYRWRVAAVLPQVKMIDLSPVAQQGEVEEV